MMDAPIVSKNVTTGGIRAQRVLHTMVSRMQ